MRAALLLLIKAYRLLVSPALGPCCRYVPSCSAYALTAVELHGAWTGTRLAAWRVLRCNPWCLGGCDPVPEAVPPLFSRWCTPPAAPDPDRKNLE